jgi:hypothetical protein
LAALFIFTKTPGDAFPKAKLVGERIRPSHWECCPQPAFIRVINVLKNQKAIDGIGVMVQSLNTARDC